MIAVYIMNKQRTLLTRKQTDICQIDEINICLIITKIFLKKGIRLCIRVYKRERETEKERNTERERERKREREKEPE